MAVTKRGQYRTDRRSKRIERTFLRGLFLRFAFPLRLGLPFTPGQFLTRRRATNSRAPTAAERLNSRRRRRRSSKRTSRTRKRRSLRYLRTTGLVRLLIIAPSNRDRSGTPSIAELFRLGKGNGRVRGADGCDSVFGCRCRDGLCRFGSGCVGGCDRCSGRSSGRGRGLRDGRRGSA